MLHHLRFRARRFTTEYDAHKFIARLRKPNAFAIVKHEGSIYVMKIALAYKLRQQSLKPGITF